MRGVIGIDIHPTFREVVIWEKEVLRHAGRVDMTRTELEGFGRSLWATDEVVVQPICKVVPIAPLTYYERKAREVDRSRCPVWARRDGQLLEEIRRVWEENFRVYGVRKVWRQLAGIAAARCTVARLMRALGLRGVLRGRRVKIATPVATLPCPADRVNRVFRAPCPNTLWLPDLTYAAAWVGFVYVAFVIDAHARHIVGWRVSNSLRTDLALDALEQALYERAVGPRDALVHHGDRGSQYLSIRYTDRLAQAGIEQPVGSVGDSYDNALAESIIGLYKTEVIRPRGPWRGLESVKDRQNNPPICVVGGVTVWSRKRGRCRVRCRCERRRFAVEVTRFGAAGNDGSVSDRGWPEGSR